MPSDWSGAVAVNYAIDR